jgi:hypothetical protein
MSLLEKIIGFFRSSKKQEAFEPKPDKKVRPAGIKEAEISMGPAILRKKYTVKYLSTMINTITLSSDMKTLYLIDNGRAIGFPIDTDNGVLIGSLRGQIVVATALTTDEEEGGGASGSGAERKPAVNQEVIKVGVKSKQWTFTYNKRVGMMSIIGATEIDSSFRNEPNCEEHRVNLNDNVVKVKRKGEEIIITVFER